MVPEITLQDSRRRGEQVRGVTKEEPMEGPGKLFKQASIVICTGHRLADLERCLESLRRFRAAVAEILIVNNGPYFAPVEEVAKRNEARVIREGRRGVSCARNAGIRAALGSFVAFLDDDTQAGENWLPTLDRPTCRLRCGLRDGRRPRRESRRRCSPSL